MTDSQTGSNTRRTVGVLTVEAGKLIRHSNANRLEAGRLLLEAREVCPHGEWQDALREQGIPKRTASRLILFARCGVQIGHCAVLTDGQLEAVIGHMMGLARRCEEVERQRRRDSDMPDSWHDQWHLSPSEIRAQRWQWAGELVAVVANRPDAPDFADLLRAA